MGTRDFPDMYALGLQAAYIPPIQQTLNCNVVTTQLRMLGMGLHNICSMEFSFDLRCESVTLFILHGSQSCDLARQN